MRKPNRNAPDRNRIEAVQYARATCALEGVRQSRLGSTLAQKFIDGDISIDDAIKEARSFYGLAR